MTERTRVHEWTGMMPEVLGAHETIEYWLEGEQEPRTDRAGNLYWGGGPGRIVAWRRLGAVPTINPKDAVGSYKLPLHLWPAEATALGCLGLLDGRGKYGRDNYVAGDGVIASIYVDACKRHLDAWFAGEEIDRDSKLPHLAHALACLAILAKAEAHGKLVDDRSYDPEGAYRMFVDKLTLLVKPTIDAHAANRPHHWTIKDARAKT